MTTLRRPDGQGGFTLIELLIVIAVSAIILVPIFGLLTATYNRLGPVREANDSSAQLRVMRTALITDWARGRVIRMKATESFTDCLVENPGEQNGVCEGLVGDPDAAGAALPAAKMDCRGGAYPFSASNVTPVLAINTHVSGNNNGTRIVYSTVTYPDPKDSSQTLIDVVRRECGHWPDVSPPAQGGYDYWAGSCGIAICTISADPAAHTATNNERVVVEGVRRIEIQRACNNVNQTPPYRPCDSSITLWAEDGQSTTVRLRQQVVSTGLMVAGAAQANIGLDIAGRPS